MNVFKIVEDGLVHSEDIDISYTNTPLGYYPRILDAALALIELRKKFDEAQSVNEPITRYHDGIYPLAIVLEIDGEPMGTVRYIDDSVTWVPFRVEKSDSNSS